MDANIVGAGIVGCMYNGVQVQQWAVVGCRNSGVQFSIGSGCK